MKNLTLLLLAGTLFLSNLNVFAGPEAFEIGPHNKQNLPKGKEADGIVGDFVLRNNRVEAVISANLPNRKANMGTYWNAVTPGCLYDLTLRGENNDQITIFSPSGQQGLVSFVRVSKSGADGVAAIEAVTTAANNNGLFKRHEYRLKEDWQGVLVISTFRNEGSETRSGSIDDRWTNFLTNKVSQGIAWADAVDPAHKAGYAYAWVKTDDLKLPPQVLDLKPGDEITFARFLAIGRSPAEAYGIVSSWRGATGTLKGAIRDEQGNPIPGASIILDLADGKIPLYPDAQGNFSMPWPAGQYPIEVFEIGRPSLKESISVKNGETVALNPALQPASRIVFDIRGADDRSLPCKAQFIGVDGTPSPTFGPNNRAYGCLDQYHSERGDFRVQVPPGKYRIVVTRGMEYNHLQQIVELKPGKTETVRGILRRIVDTRGWISADYHNHSTPSGDNTCGTDDRIINLAAENVEFAPTTEHNRFYDWQPHIEKLGLKNDIATIPGIELTGPGAHFNSFPFVPDPDAQDGGAPVWQKDPRLNAIVLRDFQGPKPERWVQVNHPDMVENFIDRDGDGHEDGGYWGLGSLIDGAETWGLGILAKEPFYIATASDGKESVVHRREFVWLQLLNRGHPYWCVAVSDAHTIHGNGVGGWRMYVPSSTDEPGQLDWKEAVRNSKAGKIIVTSGPFLEVTADDGTMPGGFTRAQGSIKLRIKVQCTDWIDIDRVQILVNGRQRSDLNFTRKTHSDWFSQGVVKFDREVEIPLSQDSHLIVVAYGENSDLSIGFGSSRQATWNPCAYNNPIFVDVDGAGFTFNGDTLGWPLPTKGLTVEQAKAMLGLGN